MHPQASARFEPPTVRAGSAHAPTGAQVAPPSPVYQTPPREVADPARDPGPVDGLAATDDAGTDGNPAIGRGRQGLGLWPAPPPSGCRSRLPLGEDPGQSIGEGLPVQARLQLGVVCRTPPRAALLRLLGAEGLEVLGGLRARGPAAQTGARLAGHGCASSVRGLGPTRIQPSWTSCGILGR